MKLSERLKAFRADRPDEWTMDEFIRMATKLEKALDKIIDRAQKVDGWESFPESWIDEAYEALKEQVK